MSISTSEINLHSRILSIYLDHGASPLWKALFFCALQASSVAFGSHFCNYDAMFFANCLWVDFLLMFQRFFTRNICSNFYETIVVNLQNNPRFWNLLNRVSTHSFYLALRHQMLYCLNQSFMRCYRHPGLNLIEAHDNLPIWGPGEPYDAFQATRGKSF
jgi:hypothetical protein